MTSKSMVESDLEKEMEQFYDCLDPNTRKIRRLKKYY